MKLLVAGSRFRTRALYRWLRRANAGMVAYFSDSGQAVAALREKDENFDCALLEDGMEKPEGREIVQRLRSVNSRVHVAFLAPSSPEERRDLPTSPRLVGFFERSKKGKRLLGCQLSQAGPPGAAFNASFGETLTYEYRAECTRKKAGNE